jgi:molybdate transport system substrate-binding protein
MSKIHRFPAVLAFAVLALFQARAQQASNLETPITLSVAAAANLTYALAPLDAAFARSNPGVAVVPVLGSSGNLLAQIRNGAPYDVLLSADMDFPRRLVQAGGAEASSLTVFAIGRLVLWTIKPEVPMNSLADTVRSPVVLKLAIANSATAPYGRAALQAMERLGILGEARPKLVVGENISQTAQFVETGNADAGFVAMSLVLAPKLKHRGRWLEVPADLYEPIAQGAVITDRGLGNPAARRYLQFLHSPAALQIFRRFGYGIPSASP